MPERPPERPLKIGLLACRVLWRECCRFAAESPHDIHLDFLPQGLHLEPNRLRAELQAGLDRADRLGLDRIVVGYGLCCLGTTGVATQKTPWVIPRAHDCITLLLGSKERYQDYFQAHPPTYWYSPGWIETGAQPSARRLEQSYAWYRERYGEDNARYLMETLEGWVKDYRRAAYVDLGGSGRERYLAYTRQCAKELNWELDILEGDGRLLRRLLNGPWDAEAFLTVPPGKTIRASGDERIVALQNESLPNQEERNHDQEKSEMDRRNRAPARD